MSISQLPPSTAHRLRSSHQLPDALSVVKELVDNSIDAGATSIEITIAPNTVDKIQVRDNGCGIQIEDFQFLGCRSHTSKIRNFDELHQNGGKTLGFRGEALASATETAAVKITTRTAQDPIASLLLLKPKTGGISKKQPVSGTVGTTVQAINLFDKFTVRKQNAIKTSRKSLVEIQRLLESYVIAIPHLKISFKVSSPSAQPWYYSPCSPSNTQEAITQVFGHTLTAQLIEVSSDSSIESGSTGEQPRALRITALLPRPDSDVQVIKGKGAFISVDSRPISSTRSTGKKLVSVFKSSISKVLGSPDSSRAPANPFLQISIQCPPGSYDPNVSQLKDEVMFDNEPAVISCFQALCDTIYIKEVPSSKGMQNKSIPSGNTLTPIAGASKALKVTGSEGRFPYKTGHEPLPSDQDLIEPLNDEFEKLLVGGSGVFGGGESTIPRAFTRSPSPSKTQHQINNVISDANQSERIQQMMRTKLCINLSRKDSDSTDVDGTDGLVPVQVTPRRAVSPPKEQLHSQSRRRTSTLGRRSEDIGSYFRPVRDEPIVIATDETATPEDTRLGDSLASPSRSNRRPLKELTQSEVNTFQEEEEEEFSDSESLVELPPAEPALGPSPRTSPRRMAPPRLPNSPFRPLTRPRQSSDLDAGLQLLPNLQTPPSSDPRRTDNLARRESRRDSASILTRGQRSSQGSMIPSTNRTGDQGLRQSRILLGSGPTASYDRRRPEQVGRGNGLAGRRNAATSRDSSDAHLKDWLHNVNANSEDQEG
jgi:DNA mismatch repair protein MutL